MKRITDRELKRNFAEEVKNTLIDGINVLLKKRQEIDRKIKNLTDKLKIAENELSKYK